MSQRTRRRIAGQIQALRTATQLPFADLLDRSLVQAILTEQRVRFRDRLFNPLVTLWAFLSQVLSPDHSCREAVARFLAFRIARGQAPCSPDTGSYCKARARLPESVPAQLVRRAGRRLQQRAPEAWLWKGRHVLLVDGTTVSMPDTEANQGDYPQAETQAVGLGFPIARLVALISLATGAVLDLAIGPYQGKQTGEPALFRTLWDRLQAGDIVVGDRAFCSYLGIAPLVQRGVDALVRMHHLRDFDFRRGRRLGVLDHAVPWSKPDRPRWLDKQASDQLPDGMVIRELRVRVAQAGFRVRELVLVTTLLDPVQYPKEHLADLYLGRWDIEISHPDYPPRRHLSRAA